MALRRSFAGGLFFCLLWSPLALAEQTGQFCWAFGSYDRTVYFAAIEGREDRSESFRDLLYISGIDFTDCRCVKQNVNVHQSFRRAMIESWRTVELEVIDTNFLSDLDY